MLSLENYGISLESCIDFVQAKCHEKLLKAARINKYGFRYSGPFLFDIPTVTNELTWLLSHLFILGLDKANNNACFMCIHHIRLQAYQRLMGANFTPCMEGTLWLLPTMVIDTAWAQLLQLLPESPPPYKALPFLMATFKQHKGTYRWLTNAFRTLYTHIAKLITISLI
jgi:hypothetical protein